MANVERLDAAASASAIPRLAEILVACVDTGASVSFLPPMAMQTAVNFYRAVASDVAGGRKILLAGWIDGVLSGTVTLSFATQENQPHRAWPRPDTTRRAGGNRRRPLAADARHQRG